MEHCRRLAIPCSDLSVYVRLIDRDGVKELRGGIGRFKHVESGLDVLDTSRRVSLPWSHYKTLCDKETLDIISDVLQSESEGEVEIKGQSFVKIEFDAQGKSVVTVYRKVSRGVNNIKISVSHWTVVSIMLRQLLEKGEELERLL